VDPPVTTERNLSSRGSGHPEWDRPSTAGTRTVLLRIRDLDDLAELVARAPDAERLHVRWSRGPDVDLMHGGAGSASSRDSEWGPLDRRTSP